MYNTLTKNRVNETFHIIDRGIGQNVSPQIHMARLLTGENLHPDRILHVHPGHR